MTIGSNLFLCGVAGLGAIGLYAIVTQREDIAAQWVEHQAKINEPIRLAKEAKDLEAANERARLDSLRQAQAEQKRIESIGDQWAYNVEKDSMNDKVEHYLVTTSGVNALSIQCTDNSFYIRVLQLGQFDPLQMIMYRVDSKPPVTSMWVRAENMTLVAPNSVTVIRQMVDAKKFSFRFKNMLGIQQDLIFDIEGLDKKIKPLLKQCVL